MLPPKLRELWNDLEEARSVTLGMVNGFSDAGFLHRPEGQWSAADILEHLLLAETGTSKVIRKVLKESAGKLPPYPADDSVLGALPRQVSPGTITEAPAVAQPKGGYGRKELLEQAAACRAQTRVSIEMLSGVDPRSATFPHAVLGPLNLYEWPRLLVLDHERRHHAQIADILEGLRRR